MWIYTLANIFIFVSCGLKVKFYFLLLLGVWVPQYFFAIYTKENNSCDFLFALMDEEVLSKEVSS